MKSEPLWCDVRQHYCRCHDFGKRCEEWASWSDGMGGTFSAGTSVFCPECKCTPCLTTCSNAALQNKSEEK